MGYDMYWAKASVEGSAKVPNDRPDYFRLTNRGMAKAYVLMHIFEMVNDAESCRRLPQPVDFDLTYVPPRWDEAGGWIAYEPGSAEEQYFAAREAARDGDSGGLIPAFKVASNDGWLVTGAEITRSLEVYDERFPDRESQPRKLPAPVAPPEKTEDGKWTCEVEDADWWGEWIDWLREAAVHGGFRVF
jgi:hypothetical protein